jgi:hypothetical protein
MILTAVMEGIFKAGAVLSVLVKACIIPCHDRGHNVVLVLQSCTDSLKVLPSSFSDTFPPSSDGTYIVRDVKVENNVDVKKEQEEEEDVNVKAEYIHSEEETRINITDECIDIKNECIDIKLEDGSHSEEGEEVDVDVNEEVS